MNKRIGVNELNRKACAVPQFEVKFQGFTAQINEGCACKRLPPFNVA